ncbi:MarC family protein [bacterium]|nr:MarC family protein [bacterium]
MVASLVFLAKCVVPIFVIMDPFGNVPIVLGLTPHMSPAERRAVLRRASLTAFAILFGFAIAGQLILAGFGVTIGAFRIAGGVLLFLVSLSMLYGESSPTKRFHAPQAPESEDVSVTPIGTPLLAGPATIVSVMSLMDEARGLGEIALVLAAIPIAVGASHALLVLGDRMLARLGRNGMKVLARLMGLVLAVLAVQFIINGARDALPFILSRS